MQDQGGLMGITILPWEHNDEEKYEVFTVTANQPWDPQKQVLLQNAMLVNPTLSAPTKRAGEKGGIRALILILLLSLSPVFWQGGVRIYQQISLKLLIPVAGIRFSSPKLPLNPEIHMFKREAKVKHKPKIKLETQNKPRRSERIRTNHANLDYQQPGSQAANHPN